MGDAEDEVPVGYGLEDFFTQPFTEFHHALLTCPPWPTRLGEEDSFLSLTQVLKQHRILQARQAGGRMGKNAGVCMGLRIKCQILHSE